MGIFNYIGQYLNVTYNIKTLIRVGWNSHLSNIGQYWTLLDNIGQYGVILDNIGQYTTILGNIGQYWTILDDIGQFVSYLNVPNNNKTLIRVSWNSHLSNIWQY